MAIDPGTATIAASVIGGLFGGGGESAAQKAQRRLMNRQIKEYDYQSDMRDELMEYVRANEGLFNPGKVLDSLSARDIQNEKLEAGALGAGYAAAGYRPGDTPVGDGLTRVGAQHRQYRDDLAISLPREMFAQRMNAYNAVRNPNGGLLNDAAGIAGNLKERSNGIPEALGAYLMYQANKPATQPGGTVYSTPPIVPSSKLPDYQSIPYAAPKMFDIGSYSSRLGSMKY